MLAVEMHTLCCYSSLNGFQECRKAGELGSLLPSAVPGLDKEEGVSIVASSIFET